MNVTVYCGRDHMQAVLKKIADRLADPRLRSNPHKGKNQAELEIVVWKRIEKEINLYLKEHSDNVSNIVNHAFVFGEMLNDTVFMLTPVSSVSGAVQRHIFDASSPSSGLLSYDLDFYERI